MNVVRLGPEDIEGLAYLLTDHLDREPHGDILMAWDPIDEGIKVKDGIWTPAIGKPVKV